MRQSTRGNSGWETGVPRAGRRIWERVDVDLRRREWRQQADRLVRLSQWLRPDERAMVDSVFGRGISAAKLAVIRGESARAMRRRIQRIVKRMASAEYRAVARWCGDWPAARQRVARACFLEGRTLREAAKVLGISVHTVRAHLSAVRAIVDALERKESKNGERRAKAGRSRGASGAGGGEGGVDRAAPEEDGVHEEEAAEARV
ncbi:MAG TPA: hypothetical protein VG797_10020 [Phycisphaerales bacterium]|nr:hypothetical protein [Phycisphaerales bacterium]